jgi:predicted acyltransferase
MALDVLRGITIAGMILVNNPGGWDEIYSPLRHASWNGLTPTDLVFPFFMFIMGVSSYLSLRKYNFDACRLENCQANGADIFCRPVPHMVLDVCARRL